MQQKSWHGFGENTDCGNREEINNVTLRFLGWASSHFWKNWQVRHGDQPWYHKHWIGVFVGTWPIHAPGAPCIKFNLELERERTKEEKEREEVLHLFRCYTHTPGRSRVNPERQEEEKSGHTTGRRPKTAQGGRGTDGPPEPTYTAKRTWPKQRTHLNPTTHYGEARGEN